MAHVVESTSIRRAGVIGDVHCESGGLEQAIGHLRRQNVDVLLCVGDLVDGPGDADETCRILREQQVVCVAGNHERWLLAGEKRSLPFATQTVTAATRSFLESLPRTRVFKTPAGNLLLCHGVGENDEAELRPDTRGYGLKDIPELRELMLDDNVTFSLGGHTHEFMIRRFKGVTVINAGTIYRKFDPAFLLIDFDALKVLRFAAGAENFGTLLSETKLPLPA